MTFEREKYYTLTEILGRFQIKEKELKMVIEHLKIDVIKKPVNLGLYEVIAWYIPKEDIDKLNLKPKKNPRR